MIRRSAALVGCLLLVCLLVPMLGAPSSAAPVIVGRVHGTYQPTDGKIFILVIGNDARSGNPDASRADAIHIVGVNTKTMKGGILNFPRDSWVSIPGYHTAKINEALYAGGPDLLARTLENITGIRLDYWVMTGFEGFRGIVDDVGGVKMNIPKAVYDPSGSGAKIDAGVQNLGPLDALAYVRTRHSFSGGDFTRTENQGRFLIAMLRKLQRQVDYNPAALLDWIAVGRKYARFDLSADELFRLGMLASQIPADRIGNVTVPASVGSVGAASVVFLSNASSLYSRFERNASL